MVNWDKVNAVQKMQDFIETHLNEPITLHMLAEVSDYSPWHSSRIFKELLGKTPFEYIRNLRISRAALEIRDRKPKIIDVALDFVFDSHEGFTRAFSKQFGMSPSAYGKKTPPIYLFMPTNIRDYYLSLEKGVDLMTEKAVSILNTIFVQVIERPERKLLLKRGIKATHYFEYCEEVSCDVWGMLTSVKEALYEPIGMWLHESMIPVGTSIYAQGVEVPADYAGETPEGFDLITLKPCKMMIFQGQPYDDEHFEAAIEAFWESLKSYDPKLYGFEWADDEGPRFQLMPLGYRGYIEGRPVKLISEK